MYLKNFQHFALVWVIQKQRTRKREKWIDGLLVGELYGIGKQGNIFELGYGMGSTGTSVLEMGVWCRVTVSKHPLNYTIFYM